MSAYSNGEAIISPGNDDEEERHDDLESSIQYEYVNSLNGPIEERTIA